MKELVFYSVQKTTHRIFSIICHFENTFLFQKMTGMATQQLQAETVAEELTQTKASCFTELLKSSENDLRHLGIWLHFYQKKK